MENTAFDPHPPDLEGLTWRPITIDDLAALVELAGECLLADGGLAFLFEADYLKERYFPDAPGADVGAFGPDGRLAACTAVHTRGDPGAQRVIIYGLVRPDLRGRGIGTYLMRWSLVQARSLLADVAEDKRVLQIATETLTESAHRLYQEHGFERVFEELVMHRDLHLLLPDRPLPDGVEIASWEPDLLEQFFQAYSNSFRDRPGFPGWSAEKWINDVVDDGFKPEWSVLASASGVPLGFVTAYIVAPNPPGGYVWQFGVVPAWRRRGLGSAVMVRRTTSEDGG